MCSQLCQKLRNQFKLCTPTRYPRSTPTLTTQKSVPSTKVGFLEGTVGVRVRNKGYLCHSLPLSDDSSESEGANADHRPEMDDARNGRGGRGNAEVP